MFASTAWAEAQQAPAAGQIQQEGSIAPQAAQGRGRGRNAGPALPTPKLADGTVNFGRVPGEKGIWNLPYIQNMAMNVIDPATGQPVAEIQAQRAAQAAARAGGAGRAAGAGGGAGGGARGGRRPGGRRRGGWRRWRGRTRRPEVRAVDAIPAVGRSGL